MAIKTEHCGPKRGHGFWGRKQEAKSVSRRLRRARGKRIIRQSLEENIFMETTDGK